MRTAGEDMPPCVPPSEHPPQYTLSPCKLSRKKEEQAYVSEIRLDRADLDRCAIGLRMRLEGAPDVGTEES